MDLNRSSIINSLEIELRKPLPGIDFQKKMAPESRIRNLVPETGELKKSAVLLLLYNRDNVIHIVFIKRAENDSVHSGQISFPGGKFDDGDKDLIHTSLRETHEEIGVNTNDVLILGSLSVLLIPVSNYLVYPTVGYCINEPHFLINEDEVAGIIEIPLTHFIKAENATMGTVEVRGNQFEVPLFKTDEIQIWGATAMIMSEFVEVLRKVYERIEN